MTSRSFPLTPGHNFFVLFLALTISASLVIFCSIFYFLYHLWLSVVNRAKTIPFDANSPLKLQRFSYKELKQATNGFHTENVIGKGGSSTVFKGKLKDGNFIAIKRLDALCLQTEQDFQNELQILSELTSPFVVTLLGYCMEKNKRALVFEYLPKRSLQELLFGDDIYLSWEKRFLVILDVARALEFLHLECNPPVIHGDIKPSNVLLDEEFHAKISDFGLSRIKVEEGEFGGNMFSQELSDHNKSQELWKSQELSGNLTADSSVVEHVNEVDFAQALQASSSSKYSSNRVGFNAGSMNLNSLNHNVKGKEISSLDIGGDDDFPSNVDHGKELNVNAFSVEEEKPDGKQWGNSDWWWKQDDENAELCSKDYVMEWIGSQIHPSNNDWDEEKNIPEKTEQENSSPTDKPDDDADNGADENKESVEKKHHKNMQELWKEENLAESSKNNGNLMKNLQTKGTFYLCGCKKFQMEDQQDEYDKKNGDLSFRRGWSKEEEEKGNISPSIGSEMRSGELFSSATSMRGTLSYVAPEYNGCCEGWFSMEKTDIYSFGVLILVIVSGRRPLSHVLASPPLKKLEKANLVSWCRQLAKSGNILELVDDKLREDYNKEEASLCINLALSCLQRNPELRPHTGDIVKILKGDIDICN